MKRELGLLLRVQRDSACQLAAVLRREGNRSNVVWHSGDRRGRLGGKHYISKLYKDVQTDPVVLAVRARNRPRAEDPTAPIRHGNLQGPHGRIRGTARLKRTSEVLH